MDNIQFISFEELLEQSNQSEKMDFDSENKNPYEQNCQDESNKSSLQLSLNHQNQSSSNCKLAQFLTISISPFYYDGSINLRTGLQIQGDGSLRLSTALDPISFGFQQEIIHQVENKKNLGVINIIMDRDTNYYRNSLNDALNFMEHRPNSDYNKVISMIYKNSYMVDFLQEKLSGLQIEQYQQEKDSEFSRFINFCFYYIEIYNQNNPNSMYTYQIGRINYGLKDLEYVQQGYSKSYLELLGIDHSTLQQILLRKKQIDLIKNKQDITSYTLKALEIIEQGLQEEFYEQEILTFDGFPLKLKQKQNNLNHIFKTNLHVQRLPCEYILVFTEIDVDIDQLQQLIQYRQRISSAEKEKNKNNIDEFIQRELSYRFEDVEYSVQSEEFLQKYYPQNIDSLLEQKDRKKKEKRTKLPNLSQQLI